MKNKKKILLIVVGILLTLGIVVGVSYAWWTARATQESVNTIQSTCLEIELSDETSAITLQNAYPITDAEAKVSLTPYTFTIKNKCNTMIEYDVNLEIMESKDSEGKDNRLSSSYVAIEFNGGAKKLLNTLEARTPTYKKAATETEEAMEAVEGRYLTSGELGSNGSISYTIKLWMDESVEVEDDAMNKNFISKVVVTAKQSHKIRLVDYVINDNETEEFEHEATAQTKVLTDYRYTGANPNNYVYFGCEGDACTEDNLYRIIGIMPTQSEVGGEYENRVKLVKASHYIEEESGYLKSADTRFPTETGYGYFYNQKGTNKWEESTVNTEVLNKVYWNNLGEYQKYIVASVWYLGATSVHSRDVYTPEQFYTLERSSTQGWNKGALSYINNIGLMYPSDYLYTVGNSYKNQTAFKNEIYNTNSWIHRNYFEHFISPDNENPSPNPPRNWSNDGKRVVDCAYVSSSTNLGIRPTFYLKSNVLYKSGNGSQEVPFRISIDE